MLTDAREVPRGSVLRADLCVIGGGAAGITIAREFANTSRSVILLESGGTELDQETQALATAEAVGQPYHVPLDAARVRMAGGTTNHWGGWCRPLDDVDFGSRPGRPDDAWPLTRDDLEPWYVRAHETIQIGPYEYDWRWWRPRLGVAPAVLDTETVATFVTQVALDYSGVPRRFNEMYFTALVEAANVQFCVWANVLELESNGSGSRVTGAKVATLDGNRWRVEAPTFVVAAGGLETPRLLLASRSSNPNGLGNDHDLVGRYFMEHIRVADQASLVLTRPLEELSLYNGLLRAPVAPGRREQYMQGELRPTPAAIDRHELLGLEIVIVPEVLDSETVNDELVTAGDVSRLLERVEGPASTVARVVAGGEQRPDPESRVRLSAEQDELGMPKLELDWRVGRDDRESVVRGLMLMGSELARTGVGRLRLTPAGGRPSMVPAGSRPEGLSDELLDLQVEGAYHHMGTARMHDDPRRGVVDSACKVHGVENLYVASSAVFTTGGTSPPTNTIVALTHRLADHLHREVLV